MPSSGSLLSGGLHDYDTCVVPNHVGDSWTFFIWLFCSSYVRYHRLIILVLEWVNISMWFFCCGYIVYLRSIAKDMCTAGLPHSQVCVLWFCLFAEEYIVHLCALGCSSVTRQSSNWMVFSIGTLFFACHYHSTNNPYSLCPSTLNPLNPELNPICYMLALLAHHFLHVSRIRVKSLTIRLLMSYIYGAPILDVSRSHTTMQHSR